MSYVQARGYLPGGSEPFVVRWQDGVWSGFEPILALIEAAKAEGPVSLTATGPLEPSDTPRAAAYLAGSIFERVESYETDIPLEVAPLPVGAIS